MSYLGKHRAPRPLALRLPVVGGVAAAALLIYPVMMVTANVGDGSRPSARFRNVAGAERVPTSVPKDGTASIPATTSIPIDEDDPVSVADGARPNSTTTTAGGWSAASHSGDVFALAADPLSHPASADRTTTSTTRATTGTTKPAASTTKPTSKPTTSKPSSTTKPPTTDPTTTTDPPASDPTTTTPADPTTEPEPDPTTTTTDPTTPETTEATTTDPADDTPTVSP
jgi:hypothetical protein